MYAFLQAAAIFAVSIIFFLLCAPLLIFAAPALIAWYSSPAAPLDSAIA